MRGSAGWPTSPKLMGIIRLRERLAPLPPLCESRSLRRAMVESTAETATHLGLAEGALIEPGLLLGLMLLAAFAGASLARPLRIPRVVGYLAAGVFLKLCVVAATVRGSDFGWHDALEAAMAAAEPLEALTDLALGLILFFIGAVFEVSHMRSVGPRALRIGLLEMGCTFVLVAAVCCLIAALTESDIPVQSKAMSALVEFSELVPVYDV